MKVECRRMRLADLELLELNARYMKAETFARLVENIKRDGCLTQTPFAALQPSGRYRVLSGNHRVKAGLQAGVEEDWVMVTEDHLEDQHALAIQLSHNAIAGEDDPAVLKQLYEQLEDVDWRSYSALDDKTLKLLDEVKLDSIGEANLDYASVTLIFLPHELEKAREALADCKATQGYSEAWLAPLRAYDQTLNALAETGAALKVTNIATQWLTILTIYGNHREDLAEAWEWEDDNKSRWVPISSIVGTDQIPVGVAKVLRQAVERISNHAELTAKNRFQALEYLAAEYLAGPHE